MKRLLLLFVLFVSVCQGYVIDKPILGIPLNSEHNLSRGLVGVWLFNERPGVLGRAYDLSGNSYHGDLIADAHAIPGLRGPALDLDGDQDSVYMGHPNLVAGGTEMTIVAFVKNRSGDTPPTTVYMARQGNSGGNRVFTLRWDAGQNVRFEVLNTSGSSIAGQFTDGIQDAEWHQVVGVLDGVNVSVCIDGVRGLIEGAWTGVIETDESAGLDGLRIGASVSGSTIEEEWDGQIGYVLIYNRALSSREISEQVPDPFQMFEQERLVVAAAAEAEEYSHVMIIMGSASWIVLCIAFGFWNSKRKTV